MTDDPTGHQSLAAEARALLDVVAEKLAAASTPGAPPEPHPTRCTGCPFCAALTYLRDHRELSAQLSQGALLIVGAVRQYLDQPGAPVPPAHPRPPAPPPASVQRIDIT